MNDFEKSMFIFFDEWGGSPEFQAEHDVLHFLGVELEWPLTKDEMDLVNELDELGWDLDEDGNFKSTRWGTP